MDSDPLSSAPSTVDFHLDGLSYLDLCHVWRFCLQQRLHSDSTSMVLARGIGGLLGGESRFPQRLS